MGSLAPRIDTRGVAIGNGVGRRERKRKREEGEGERRRRRKRGRRESAKHLDYIGRSLLEEEQPSLWAGKFRIGGRECLVGLRDAGKTWRLSLL